MPPEDEALAELRRLADDLGPAFVPVGTEALLHAITSAARALFGAAACSLALLSEDEAELVFTTASGVGQQSVTGMRIPAGTGIAGYVVMSGQPIAVADLSRDVRFAEGVAAGTGYLPRSMLAVPVASPSRTLGVIEVLDRDEQRADAQHDIRLLGLFADQAALAIESARVFTDLGRMLLRSLAAGAPGGLAASLAAAAAAERRRPDEMARIAALFAELGRRGPAEWGLAVRLLEDVLRYTDARPWD